MALNKKIMEEIDAEIIASPATLELKACLALANATDIIMREADREIRRIYAKRGIKVRADNGEDSILTGLYCYCKAVKNAFYWFSRGVESHIEDGTFGSYGAEAYDRFRVSANQLAMLNLLMIDRCGMDGDAEKVAEFIKTIAPECSVPDEVLERFKLK